MVTHHKRYALSKRCLHALTRLTPTVQKQARQAIDKFMESRDLPGLNYEKLESAADKSMRTLRVNDNFRLVCSEQDGEVLLLNVLPHEEAYRWAESHKLSLERMTGVLQVVDVQEVEAPPSPAAAATAAAPAEPLFAGVDDETLMAILRVEDAALLAPVRALVSPEEITQRQAALEQAFGAYAADKLSDLAGGEPPEVIIDVYNSPSLPKSVSEALENPATRGEFFLATDDDAVRVALQYPLDLWRIFLHPQQEKLAYRDFSEPVRVTGGAGTGKTVAAMHRAKYLAEKLSQEDAEGRKKVLFTTFSKALVADIKGNLAKICTPEQMARIEVINLDAWASKLLRQQGMVFSPAFARKKLCEELWEEALDAIPNRDELPAAMTDAEIRREWELVALDRGAQSLLEYLRAPRMGRGIRLTKKHKALLWKVFEEYRALLQDHQLLETEDMYREVTKLLEREPGVALRYAAVIVDEAQDFGNQAFTMLGALAECFESKVNRLYITGDSHQRIYNRRVVLSSCGINVRGGRSRRLKLNYRTTEETRQWAVAVLQGVEYDDLDGRAESLDGYRSATTGEKPKVVRTRSHEEALDALVAEIGRLAPAEKEEPAPRRDNICVTFPNNKLLAQYAGDLEARGIPCVKLGEEADTGKKPECARLATMHRVKGLEFDYMMLVGLDDAGFQKELRSPEMAQQKRSLIHVAATRARKRLFVIGWEDPGD